MAARFCANCGTEVDDSAVFCPTCGQPIDEDAEAEMPPAPAWPEPEDDDEEGAADEPTRVEERPAPAPVATEPPPARPAAARAPRREGPSFDLPLTTPVTLSGWLIGVGTLLAAIGVAIGLFEGVLNPIEIILMLALIGIAATVFFSASIPAMPHLRLATLAVVLIGFGMALDRLSFGGGGVSELLLFLGTAAAAIGAIILEVGHDQPMGRAAG